MAVEQERVRCRLPHIPHVAVHSDHDDHSLHVAVGAGVVRVGVVAAWTSVHVCDCISKLPHLYHI